MKRIIITLCTLCLAIAALAQTNRGSLYKAIVEQSELTDGKYLIVSEEGNAALNSNDLTSKNVSVKNGTVIIPTNDDNFYFTYNSVKKYLCAIDGKTISPTYYSIIKGDDYAMDINITETAAEIQNAKSLGMYILWNNTDAKFWGSPLDNGKTVNVRLYKYIDEICMHTNTTHVASSQPTCGTDGYAEHWACNDCEALSTTPDFSNIVTLDDIKVAAKGNIQYDLANATYNDDLWTNYGSQIEAYFGANQTYSREATFVLTQDAKRFLVEIYFDNYDQLLDPYMKYTIYVNKNKMVEQELNENLSGVCKYFAYDNAKKGDKVRIVVAKTKTILDPSLETNLYVSLSGKYLTHTIEHIDYTDATCCIDGHYETYHCSVCNKYFSDPYGLREVNTQAVIIPSHMGFAMPENVIERGSFESNYRINNKICRNSYICKFEPARSGKGEATFKMLEDRDIVNFLSEIYVEHYYGSASFKVFINNDTEPIYETSVSYTHGSNSVKAELKNLHKGDIIRLVINNSAYTNDTEMTIVSNFSYPTDGHALEYIPEFLDCVKGNIDEHWVCVFCNKIFNTNSHPGEEGGDIAFEELTHEPIGKHELEKVEAHPSTCISGIIEHYRCNICGRLFEDENAQKELQPSDVERTTEITDIITPITPTKMDEAWSTIKSKTIYDYTFRNAAYFFSSGYSNKQVPNGIHSVEFIAEADGPAIITFALVSMGSSQADFLLRFFHNGQVVYAANKDFMKKNGKFEHIINNVKAGDIIRVELEKQTTYTWNTDDKKTYVTVEYATDDHHGHKFVEVPTQYDCINGDIEQHWQCETCHSLFSSCRNPGNNKDIIKNIEEMRSAPRGHHTDTDGNLICDICGASLNDSSNKCGDNLYWAYDESNKVLSIFGSGNMWDYSTTTSPWDAIKSEIVTIKADGPITSISSNAFNECENLKNAYFTSPNLYTGNTSYPFNTKNDGLTVFVPADNLQDYIKAWGNEYKLDGIITFEYDATLQRCINAGWDTNNDGLISLEEALEVKKITTQFTECSSERFDEIKYFTNVTSIANEAFRYCVNLKDITLPSSVSSLGSSVFNGCSSLQAITFTSEKAPTFSNSALIGCSSLETINIPYGYAYYNSYMNNMKGLKNFEDIRYKVTFFLQGKGTEEAPYTVTNEAELADVVSYAKDGWATDKVSILMPDFEGKHYADKDNDFAYIADNALAVGGNYLVLTENAKPQVVINPHEFIIFDNVLADLNTDGIIANPDYPGYEIVNDEGKYESSAIVYTIKFMEGDNEAQFIDGFEYPTQYTIESDNIILPSYNDFPEHIGYTIAGWYESPDFSGNPVEEIPTGTIGNKVFYSKWITNSFVITDGQPYSEDRDKFYTDVTYIRSFYANVWNSWYLPFAINTDQLSTNGLTAAYINGIHQYDDDEDGNIDRTILEIIKIKNGTLRAATPYLVKPSSDYNGSVKIKEVTLKNCTEAHPVHTETALAGFDFIGTYTGIPAAEAAYKYYIMGDDNHIGPTTSYVPAIDWYVSITPKGSMFDNYDTSLVKSIIIRLIGEEDEATGIRTIYSSDKQTEEIYDLSGRRIGKPQKGQINIINGKKVYIK